MPDFESRYVRGRKSRRKEENEFENDSEDEEKSAD
jgi:hypothetical protein